MLFTISRKKAAEVFLAKKAHLSPRELCLIQSTHEKYRTNQGKQNRLFLSLWKNEQIQRLTNEGG